jgi:acyl-CoA synthetase (AMP-forming)/AMP-acid ligase II
MVPWLMSGATLSLHHPFDLKVFVEQLRSEAITVAGLPPAVIDLLKSEGAFDGDGAASSLRSLACVWPGPLLPKNAEERAADLMTGVIDIRSLGEMAYIAKRRVAGERPAELEHGEFSYPTRNVGGAVLLQTRVKGGISSNKQSASLLTGDLMIKSPMVFDAYFPAAVEGVDEPVISKDPQGFVNTGLRCLLTGNAAAKIEIIRRNSNVIFYGGLSVSANELDRLYAEFHGISDAAAFAFDDPVMGERILAAVVPQPGMTIAFDEFVDYLNERQVAPYKVPDRLVTVKSIPRDGDGAILRDKVLDQI